MSVIFGYSATAINRAERLAPDSRVTGESEVIPLARFARKPEISNNVGPIK
jgi:hypothetical protein